MDIFGIRRRLRTILRDAREAEQLRVQLAGVTAAALGWGIGPRLGAKQGDYGWSAAYADVVALRKKFEALADRYRTGDTATDHVRRINMMCCGFCGRALWANNRPENDVVVGVGAPYTIRIVTDLRVGGEVVVRMFREPDGPELMVASHVCFAIRR